MFYISSSSVRTAVDFPIKMVGIKSRFVKTEKVMAGKALKFVCDLITSRWVLNTLARVSGKFGKRNFDCQIYIDFS